MNVRTKFVLALGPTPDHPAVLMGELVIAGEATAKLCMSYLMVEVLACTALLRGTSPIPRSICLAPTQGMIV